MYMRSSGGICSELGSLPFSSYSLPLSLSFSLALPRYLEFSCKKKRKYVSPLSFAEVDTHALRALSPGCVRVWLQAENGRGEGGRKEKGFMEKSVVARVLTSVGILAYRPHWKDQRLDGESRLIVMNWKSADYNEFSSRSAPRGRRSIVGAQKRRAERFAVSCSARFSISNAFGEEASIRYSAMRCTGVNYGGIYSLSCYAHVRETRNEGSTPEVVFWSILQRRNGQRSGGIDLVRRTNENTTWSYEL